MQIQNFQEMLIRNPKFRRPVSQNNSEILFFPFLIILIELNDVHINLFSNLSTGLATLLLAVNNIIIIFWRNISAGGVQGVQVHDYNPFRQRNVSESTVSSVGSTLASGVPHVPITDLGNKPPWIRIRVVRFDLSS
jgi:hypothetical protein